MELNDFVQFYRALVKSRECSCTKIIGTLKSSEKNIKLIQSLNNNQTIGRFEEILIDDIEIDVDALSESEREIDVCYSLSTSGESHIYSNLTQFIELDKKLCLGIFPREFYIIEDDYFSKEKSVDIKYQLIEKICDLISNLSELAHYHDMKNDGLNYTLVFVNESEVSNSTPVVLKPIISADMLDIDDIDISILAELNNASENKNLVREKGVFRSSLVEFISRHDGGDVKSFKYLISNWNKFVILFKKNYDTYLSGFAFHKVKMELAKAELSIAEQFSKILGDMSGKILGIPISFAAVLTYYGNNDSWQKCIIFLGILSVSLIMHLMVSNQKSQFDRVVNAKNIIFSDLESKKKTYPPDIRSELETSIKNISDSETKLKNLFCIFQFISWSPIICVVFIFFYKP
ncbi:hypothetical protein [uncultured Tolumonas sp.]|uniref:hypothetical protein n=1 Tax=uncultured Tolumonas sp. TaxID=263765 RepID=UPI00292F52BF|nr:hypothetical protein [uncultured Tolumonas sp.]